MDVLVSLRKKHGLRFTKRVNVDIHSGGGWFPDSWAQAEVNTAISTLPPAPKHNLPRPDLTPSTRRHPHEHSPSEFDFEPRPDASQRSLPNIYASPSLLITSRSASSPYLIKSISTDRILVESDSHDVRLGAKLVWGAVEWIGRCKGWTVEGLHGEPVDEWHMTDDEESAGEMRTVRILERNWARFMRISD